MQRGFGLIVILALVAVEWPSPLRADPMPALIAQTLDAQLPKDVDFNGTLPQAIAQFGDLTGVRIEADPSVYDVLPWGDLTTFRAHLQHQTLRQALGAICAKLGLEFEPTDQTVQLRPMAALLRIGRRCTVEELELLDFLGQTPLNPAQDRITAAQFMTDLDARLAGSPYAVENRMFDAQDKTPVALARNASLLDALREMTNQTRATWYPWGRTIVVLRKLDQNRLALSKRISARFSGVDVSNVLLELSRRSGIFFQIEPGAFQRIPPAYRTIRLNLDEATYQQTLEAICGVTGLTYSVTDDGVRMFIPAPDAAAGATTRG